MGSKAEGRVVVKSPEPFRWQAVKKFVETGMEDMGGQRLRQGSTKKSGEGFYYRRKFRGDEVMECLVLKNPVLTAKKTVRWEAVSNKVTSFDEAQRNRTVGLEKRVENSEGQPVGPETAPRNNERQREERGGSRESSCGASSREVSRPRIDRVWQKKSMKYV